MRNLPNTCPGSSIPSSPPRETEREWSSICHRIISDHGGQIHVPASRAAAPIFNIHLPIQQFHAYPVAIPPVAGKDEGTRRQGGCAEGEPPARSGEDKEKPVAEETLLALRPPSL